MKTLQSLISAADRINAFGQQFCASSYSASAKAWSFDPNCALAGVTASVNDDEGGPLGPDSAPVGETRLLVDIELFRHDNTPENAHFAENELIDFAKSLGFKVAHDANMGTGQFGAINQLALS
jgi:hypothetical protein